MDSYKGLANYYDMLISDDDAQELYKEFSEKYISGTDILELGCGSGILASKLVHDHKEYHYVATDLSEDMIKVAKSNYANETITFEVMDMSENHYLNSFDTILCYCDSLNYIIGKENVLKVFEGAYKALKDQGVFIFDAHSVDRLEEFKEEYDESFYLDDLEYSWHISLDGNYIKQLLRVWDDGVIPTYFFEEHHLQEVYPSDVLLTLLKEAGFKSVDVYTDFDIPGVEHGEKQFYIAKKED